MDRDKIIQAAENDFATLLGVRESQSFEAKQEWPDFTTAMGRWEFVKDVAAMANGGGGVIVFGVSTQKHPTEQADVTHAIHAIDLALLNAGAASGILSEHVVPGLRGVRIDLVPAKILAPKGVVVLEVPPQKTKVILCKAVEGKEALKEYLFGYAERDRDGTKNWSREQVAQMIRTGTDPTSVRLETIETIVTHLQQELTAARTPPSVDYKVLEARIDEMMSDE